MPGIFALTGILSLLAIFVVLRIVPAAPAVPRQPGWSSFRQVLSNPLLLRLNFGVFALHVMQTAMWVLLPSALVSSGGLAVGEHWKVYLPAVLLSFVVMVPAIIAAEKHGRMKLVFNASIGLLLAVQLGFAFFGGYFKTDKNSFFQLTDAFAGNTKKFTDLFEGFASVVKAKAAGNNFALSFLVDKGDNVGDS